MQSLWGKEHRYLLVFTTHLDAFHDQNKGKQLEEMADFVRRSVLTEIRTILEGKEKEGWGGRPENWIKGPIGAFHADPLSRMACLFLGDFNIAAPSSTDAEIDNAAGGHSALYKDTLLGMMGSSVPLLVDFYAAVHGKDGGSLKLADASYDKINNTLVEPGPGNHGRIDHILGMESIWDDVARKKVELMKLDCLGIHIVRQPAALELSDHYPVIASFVPAPSREK
jgi:endonuclease/exonuclease/phosphatase family metal-dependent hydrolase